MKAIDYMKPIKLEEMEKVTLMNRIDLKYWINSKHLPFLLESIQDEYYILTIDGETLLPYSTTYYDTPNDAMYISHHNGKLNRFKIRHRTYVSSKISFLEIKYKNNKGRTIKTRIASSAEDLNKFKPKDEDFIEKNSPYLSHDLHISLQNNFQRITLVNKNFAERCTIDLNLQFMDSDKKLELEHIAIIEIKADGRSGNSLLARTLRDLRIKQTGFSKYCIGRSFTDSNLKQNNFKSKIRIIEKEINSNY